MLQKFILNYTIELFIFIITAHLILKVLLVPKHQSQKLDLIIRSFALHKEQTLRNLTNKNTQGYFKLSNSINYTTIILIAALIVIYTFMKMISY